MEIDNIIEQLKQAHKEIDKTELENKKEKKLKNIKELKKKISKNIKENFNNDYDHVRKYMLKCLKEEGVIN